jgi:hypothetical protein
MMNPVVEENGLIVDRLGRRFRNLRVSLTAACNFACTYCVPDGKRLQAAAYELGAQEPRTPCAAPTGGPTRVRVRRAVPTSAWRTRVSVIGQSIQVSESCNRPRHARRRIRPSA